MHTCRQRTTKDETKWSQPVPRYREDEFPVKILPGSEIEPYHVAEIMGIIKNDRSLLHFPEVISGIRRTLRYGQEGNKRC